MSKFDLTNLLNDTSNAAAMPEGMQVVQLPIDKLDRNPENNIYIVGDVTQLAEDIKANGVRSPLEVIAQPGGRYMLISGHRRLAACQQLRDGSLGMEFKTVPCVIRQSKGGPEDTIDLITANATARELTDGERLDQCQAMKKALTELKKAGKLQGRVRDEMSRILGESTGNLARFNAIAENATEEVKQLLRDGKCGLVRAYEASKLHPKQQLYYANTGTVPRTPSLTEAQKKIVTKWMLTESPAVEALRKVDYLTTQMWSFCPGPCGCNGEVTVPVGDGEGIATVVEATHGSYVKVSVADPADATYTMNEECISWRDLYDRAKRRYWPKHERERAEAAKQAKEEMLQARDDFREQVREKLEAPETWPNVTSLTAGLMLYELPLTDGSSLLALCEEVPGGADKPLLYRRVDAGGEPIPMEQGYSDISWQGHLYSPMCDTIGAVMEFDPEEMDV